MLTCKLRSFPLLSLQAFFSGGRSQTEKNVPNSLLANTRCCRIQPTTRQKAWSAVEQNPRHPHESPASRENSSTMLADGPKHDARGTEAKQVLLCKGRVLQQRLNDVHSRVGAAATRAHVESPLRTQLFVDPCSVRHQSNSCASTPASPATWISMRTKSTERCSCDKTAALARHKHTWIALRAQRDMFRQKDCCALTPRAHLDLSPCFQATTLLRLHAVSTLRSPSARKPTCSGKTTDAFCDLSPCAKRHVPAKRLLRSHTEMYEHCAAIDRVGAYEQRLN